MAQIKIISGKQITQNDPRLTQKLSLRAPAEICSSKLEFERLLEKCLHNYNFLKESYRPKRSPICDT